MTRSRVLVGWTVALAACAHLFLGADFLLAPGDPDFVAGDFSFRAALTSMRMTEDRDVDAPIPFPFRPGVARPVRLYLAATLIAFVLLPPAFALLSLRSATASRYSLPVAIGCMLLVGADAVAPVVLVGEPFQYLSRCLILVLVVPCAVFTVGGLAFRKEVSR